jgi:AmmeMemoRadiSam system protein B
MGSLISLYPDGAWQTPLGSAAIDADLARTILQGTSIIDSDRRAHTYEHSIEVQVPFLQYLYGDVRIVPVSMSLQDFETSAEVGKDIGKAIISSGTDAAVVASTDFSHYVSRDVAHENDHAAIERIVAMDPRGLYDVVQDRRISMCGYGPVMAAIAASKLLGGSRGELLKYGTSGDVTPMRDVVGYAALAFRRG